MTRGGMTVEKKIREENEKKKEYLWKYRDALRSQLAIEEEIDQLRTDKMYPASMQQDGMPHGSGCSDLSGYVAKLDELLRDLKDQLEKKIEIRREITQKIDAMPDETESLLLRYRYIHLLTWEQVAVKMGYSWKHIHRLHSSALQNFKMT